MKKPLLVLAFFAAFAAVVLFAASAPSSDLRTVLTTSTTNGVTRTLYVGRVQTDPAKEGGATLTVFPDVVLTDNAGNVVSTNLGQSFAVALTAEQYAGIASIIQAAYNAQNPE